MSKLQPDLLDEDYVFCTFIEKKYVDLKELNPIASFQEKEGMTVVITEKTAKIHNLNFEGVYKCISLKLVSALTSVGLTKKISSLLADSNISANIFAGYYHDHIFVPIENSIEALKLLSEYE